MKKGIKWVFNLLPIFLMGVGQLYVSNLEPNRNGFHASVFASAKGFSPDGETTNSSLLLCTQLTSPVNEAINVPVDATLNWMPVEGVNGYILSIGTTAGGSQIVNGLALGSGTSYTVPTGLPENTTLYVRVGLFFFDSPTVFCKEESFTTASLTQIPECTKLVSPLDGSTNVAINTDLRWTYGPRATGYRINIGTTPGGTEILDSFDAGNTLRYDPPADLPVETTLYVLIVPYNRIGNAVGCASEDFRTRDDVLPPTCTMIIAPADGATNVPLTPTIFWNSVPEATGYRLTLETSPGARNILDNTDLGDKTSTAVLNFKENTGVFVTIIPYNIAGEAMGCETTLFFTGFGCGPYTDFATGNVIDNRPVIDLDDELVACDNELPLVIDYPNPVDEILWYRVQLNGTELLISTAPQVRFAAAGDYRVEIANNILTSNGESIRCSRTKKFKVVFSKAPKIHALQLRNQGNEVQVIVDATGVGALEYALHTIDGPYQESNVFNNVPLGTITTFARDKGGCGIAQRTTSQNEGIPKYFTPNADGIHDFWQIRGLNTMGEGVSQILVFDRYGKLLKQVDPTGEGWDGSFNGVALPSSVYWYRIILADGQEINGYFALKR